MVAIFLSVIKSHIQYWQHSKQAPTTESVIMELFMPIGPTAESYFCDA